MLLRTEVPSWLYQVKQGATTVWERWDAILPDGSIHPGTMSVPPEMPDSDREESHMLSFNHYAYGAVIDWVYRHVAGLSSDPESPGYRHVILAPRPPAGLEWAGASVESAYGTVRSEWRMEQGDFIADVELPFGTTGTFLAPVTDASSVRVDGAVAESHLELGPGRHTIIVVAPLLASPSAGLLPPGSPMAAM
jgi:alpha-L-rhamnosidase